MGQLPSSISGEGVETIFLLQSIDPPPLKHINSEIDAACEYEQNGVYPISLVTA